MKKISIFRKVVSGLTVGDNPLDGYSCIVDKTSGPEMREWYTSARNLDTLFQIEESGLNTMLPLSDPFIIRLLWEYENAGGKMQWIFQPVGAVLEEVDMRNMTGLKNTVGVYHQGTTTDFLFESGRKNEVLEQLRRFRAMGIPDAIYESAKTGREVIF